ncbi:hypothetical protein [Nonomuraea zeae]|uniref:DNA primase n=1 Tax=Nonomuraea zeae TaxID=1642303 RepID=A0A5S4G477_9ACTN|nr:hypothetical protein [Nonomuraea zeae]TMR27815.1 hypothetical protein ETD85_37910 [Nonomuraea zeae]
MNETGKVALAVIAGYYLGRRHKLRMAIGLAITALMRKMRRDNGGLLAQGTKMLSSSPELAGLTDRLKGELLDVTKAAAMSAATTQIESLTTKLREQAKPEQQPKAGEQADEASSDEASSDQESSDEEKPKDQVPKQRAPKTPERVPVKTRTPGAGRKSRPRLEGQGSESR